jgi:cell division protease FtsH
MRETSNSVAAALGGELMRASQADVGHRREHRRQRRLLKIALVLAVPLAFLAYRMLDGRPFNVLALPSLPGDPVMWIIPIAFVIAIMVVVAMPLMSGRSPHVEYRPEQIDVGFDDVIGIEPIKEEVLRTLNTFLGYATYKDRLGGTPRRGLLFEGPPGTGKTHLAKAMAREAGVPFLFVSATSFQSMWYGATARKIRSYFKELRKTAREEGGAIGFIEEIDAIATRRGGMDFTPAETGSGITGMHPVRVDRSAVSESTGGVVNELLVQMQSFDDPPLGDRMYNWFVDRFNGLLPADRQFKRRPSEYNNILLIAATNRADRLDPALLRPGRFARRLTFELPAKEARRQLVDHFLHRKAHEPELDQEDLREQLAGQTFGYTPVMIEHLLDEALIHALRAGRDGMTWADVQGARLTEEVGLKNPVAYTARERNLVATHEAGHATIAYLSGLRRLEVLSIVKRAGSLGLLAHGDLDEEYNRSRSELYALMDIAMGGMAAEEHYFGEPSTGPAGDLASATRIACQIVGASGMGGSLVSLAAGDGGVFSGDLVNRTLKDATGRPEVERILAVSKARARALIAANTHILESLRDALLERDELIGEDITAVAAAAGAPVLDGIRIERRGDRRRTDHLAEERGRGAIDIPWAKDAAVVDGAEAEVS